MSLFTGLVFAELAYIFSPQEWKGWIRELYDREEEENELHTPSPSEDDVLEYMDIVKRYRKKFKIILFNIMLIKKG